MSFYSIYESKKNMFYIVGVLFFVSVGFRFVRKIFAIYGQQDLSFLRQIEFCLYVAALLYFSIKSLFFIKVKTFNSMLYPVLLLVVVLVSEVYSLYNNPFEEFSYERVYYTGKIIFPMLFLSAFSNSNVKTVPLLNIIDFLLLINGIFILFGVVLEVELFQTYPNSERWGYSGILWSNALNYTLYGVSILREWGNTNKINWKILLYSIVLLMMGQKACLLTLFLVVLLCYAKTVNVRLLMIGCGILFLSTFFFFFKKIIALTPFWSLVYKEHGFYSVLFSRRNETLLDALNIFVNDFNLIGALFGGINNMPLKIEMLPADLFFNFGLIGLLAYFSFLSKLIKNIRDAIPIFVSLFAGGVYEVPIAMLVYVLFLIESRKKSARVARN